MNNSAEIVQLLKTLPGEYWLAVLSAAGLSYIFWTGRGTERGKLSRGRFGKSQAKRRAYKAARKQLMQQWRGK